MKGKAAELTVIRNSDWVEVAVRCWWRHRLYRSSTTLSPCHYLRRSDV